MSTHRFASADSSRHPFYESPQEDPAGAATALAEESDDSILLGESLPIRRLRSQVQRIAPYFRTALIRGEIGAGKQLVARAIHAHGPCASGPFIVSNATALAEAVVKTSASPAAALLDSAHGGTLYLEAVCEIPFALQPGFFRFIRACEERRAAPFGNRPELPRSGFNTGSRLPETRILAATHRDLRTLSAIGQFRQDLYAGLSVVEIFVPPLRQRVEDLSVLAEWLLRRLAARTGHNTKWLAQSTLERLQAHPWPNNLRELEIVLGQAAALAEDVIIEPRHLLALVESLAHTPAPAAPSLERLQDIIHLHVLAVLTRCAGNKLRAAELLGISRSTLYRMLEANAASPRELPE
jgi:DNA-binding NtrC family response regulator